MREAVIECVPNFSEGNDRGKVLAIVDALRIEGVSLLDWSMDGDHQRSVVTIAGPPLAVVEGAVRAAGRAAELIDLTAQRGVHPRIGATDVIPFVPVSGISLAECAMLARQAGLSIWNRYGIPIYFYEAAASRPDRALLEYVRQGQFEGLRESALRDVTRRPDLGGPELHPTAGAIAVGARQFLIAYNLYLDRPDVAVARAIARAVRASSSGLKGVKAMGVLVRGRAQISLNITNFRMTPVGEVFAGISRCAESHAAKVVDAELIGLVPEEAFERDSEWVRLISEFKPEERILERRLLQPLEWPSIR
jgi:glutamate formiminotransferase / 5-formyltetrahydrofolate cyclo-ligase